MLAKSGSYKGLSTIIEGMQKTVSQEINLHNQALQKIYDCIHYVDEYLNVQDLKESEAVCRGNSILNDNGKNPVQQIAPQKTKKKINTDDENAVICKEQFAKKCSNLYLFLENLIATEAHSFSSGNRGKLRRAQADIQRIRLWLLRMSNENTSTS